MADPLSISASIAGLVTLADIVFCRLREYVKAVRNASKDISVLSSEIGALYGILGNLRLISSQLEGETLDSALRTHHVNSCYETLENIRLALDRSDTTSLSNQRLESAKRKLQWPFKLSEVRTFISEIERHKQTLSLALNVDSMSGLLRALSRQNDIQDDVQDIKTTIKERLEAESRVTISNDRQQILDFFGKTDPRKYLDTGRKLRHPGTGLWFIEGPEFQAWLTTENARLWLYGIPGAGKTILAASVIDEAIRTGGPNTAVAFFFCDYKNPATQEAHAILGSLAQQIAKQDEQSFETLERFYEKKNPEHRKDIIFTPADLANMITDMISSFDRTIIIVDGLDECGTSTSQVVEILVRLDHGTETELKVLFLSRDEIEIREHLETYKKVSIAARSGDLRLYVGAELEHRIRKKQLRIKDESLKAYIMKQLVEGADGMYVLCLREGCPDSHPLSICGMILIFWMQVSLGYLPDGLSLRVTKRRCSSQSTCCSSA